jgi:peptidoglycan hydrolase-like protein with peptidoglycan-binding domain
VVLSKMGDRGTRVTQLQQRLNGKPSKLPRLNPDSIFGPKTQARVIEFQKDNGLKADGIVGDLTMVKLEGGDAPSSEDIAELLNAMNSIASQLSPGQRQEFVTGAQALMPARNPNLLGAVQAVPVVLVVLFFILLMMFVIARSSNREADQEMAREWARRFQRLKESIKDKPVEVQTAETLKEAKQRGKDVADRIKADREKCLAQLDPAKLAECARVLKTLSDALQSLLQKLITPVGGGITPESLAKGIAFSIQAVFDAAKAVSKCTGCDI